MSKKIVIGCGIVIGILASLGIGWLVASVINASQQSASITEPTTGSVGLNANLFSRAGNSFNVAGNSSGLNQPSTSVTFPGVNDNPWGYNFVTGSIIYNPNSAFCSYFLCVSTFWQNTSGYVVECNDGEYSHLGGVLGACSGHGGVSQILYLPEPS
jgi:hypothetical protein